MAFIAGGGSFSREYLDKIVCVYKGSSEQSGLRASILVTALVADLLLAAVTGDERTLVRAVLRVRDGLAHALCAVGALGEGRHGEEEGRERNDRPHGGTQIQRGRDRESLTHVGCPNPSGACDGIIRTWHILRDSEPKNGQRTFKERSRESTKDGG